MIKCELIIGGYSYKITDDVMNWDDVTISLKRGNYDGIVRSFSSKFEFVNTAYSLLKKQYRDNYLGAAASIVISKRNNSWTWNEIFRCTLDFSTYEDSGRVISINAVDDTLAAIIKSKKSVQYEYLVTEFNPITLNYDRINLASTASYMFGGGDTNADGSISFSFNKSFASVSELNQTISMFNEEIYNNPGLEFLYDWTTKGGVDEHAVMRNISDKIIPISINVDLDISVLQENTNLKHVFFSISPSLRSLNKDPIISEKVTPGNSTSYKCNFNYDLSPSEYIEFDIYPSAINIRNNYAGIVVVKINDISVTYKSKGDPISIDLIPLDVLASKLLKSMTGESSPYRVEISNYIPDFGIGRLNNAHIMAAESIRGIPKAKLYTSFNKFCDWMESEFGYVPIIDSNVITFTHRDDLFLGDTVKDIGKNINNFQYNVNSSLIYSSIKVGYDKQDYDSINGRDEFRFTNEFSTGIDLTDNVLSLISPYRSDAYGIEFLAQKRGKDTTDNESDNDVFFVAAIGIRDPSSGSIRMILDRPYLAKELSGLISPETMFNLQYSPRFMIEANKSYIAACTKLIKFTSSNGNSGVSINGIKETDDMVLESRLFTVGEVEVETSDIDTPTNLKGLVTLNNNGEIIRGYIKQLKINAGKEESVKYSLIVKDIKN